MWEMCVNVNSEALTPLGGAAGECYSVTVCGSRSSQFGLPHRLGAASKVPHQRLSLPCLGAKELQPERAFLS